MATYGITATGFVTKQQQDIIAELQASFKAVFGQNINLNPRSNFGQIINIVSEREALLWQLAESVANSRKISGAEGTSVDDILALNNLRRADATPTVTSPTVNSIPGLVLGGVAGTLIPKGSLISVQGSPQVQFSTDQDNTIGNALSCVQNIFFTSMPTTGSWTLSIVDQFGNTLTTTTLAYNCTAADVQAAIRALQDTTQTGHPYPYTDVTVTGSFGVSFTISFGSVTPTGGNPSSGNQSQNLFTAVSSLLNMTTVVNINPVMSQAGTAAVASGGSATCVANTISNDGTGPLFVSAGSLNVIDSPIAGWNTVNNPLDCITGTALETDTQALTRRTAFLNAQANGPLLAIIEKVAKVTGVTQVIGFENNYDAANQKIYFGAVPVSGNWQIEIDVQITASLAYNATAAQVQTALQAIPAFSAAVVSGNYAAGFTIDFNGSSGGQDMPLANIVGNSLSDGTSPVGVTVSFTRSGHSVEIVAQGGTDLDIANAILKSKSGGIQAYGSVKETVTDQYLNEYLIGFNRPTPVIFYVLIQLVTDLNAQNPTFQPSSISQIQQDIVTIGNAVAIGGLVKGFGTDGLIGAFNDVPGINSYTLLFGRTPGPTGNAGVQLQPEELPVFETFNCIVSYT